MLLCSYRLHRLHQVSMHNHTHTFTPTNYSHRHNSINYVATWVLHHSYVHLQHSHSLIRPFHTRPKKQIQCASNAHSSCSHLNPVLGDAHQVNPPLEVDWNRIWTDFIVNSLNNDKITHGYASMSSNIVEALHLCHHTRCICHPRYELQWPIVLGRYWLQSVDAVDKETAYLWVVSCSSSKFTFHYQWQGKTNNWMDFVCFNTSRMLAR